jgi:hypothetical protein
MPLASQSIELFSLSKESWRKILKKFTGLQRAENVIHPKARRHGPFSGLQTMRNGL